MTKKEAIEFGKVTLELFEDAKDSTTYQFTQMAIKALEQQPCQDCVSRAKVLEIYDEWFATCNIADRRESPKAKIKALPSVAPRYEKGKWIVHDYADTRDGAMIPNYECTCCHSWVENNSTYCPNCGAYMEGTRD